MKSFKRLLLASAIIMGFAQSAQAGLHVEPYLNYAFNGEVQRGSSKDDYSGGPILGARLGYGMMGLFVAADYEMGTLEQDSTPKVDVDQTNLGISVGYEFPILLRIYGTYFFNAEAKAGVNKYEGTGTRLGIGYTGLPFVAINFEMVDMGYDELNGNTLTPELETRYYSIGVSLPLDL